MIKSYITFLLFSNENNKNPVILFYLFINLFIKKLIYMK